MGARMYLILLGIAASQHFSYGVSTDGEDDTAEQLQQSDWHYVSDPLDLIGDIVRPEAELVYEAPEPRIYELHEGSDEWNITDVEEPESKDEEESSYSSSEDYESSDDFDNGDSEEFTDSSDETSEDDSSEADRINGRPALATRSEQHWRGGDYQLSPDDDSDDSEETDDDERGGRNKWRRKRKNRQWQKRKHQPRYPDQDRDVSDEQEDSQETAEDGKLVHRRKGRHDRKRQRRPSARHQNIPVSSDSEDAPGRNGKNNRGKFARKEQIKKQRNRARLLKKRQRKIHFRNQKWINDNRYDVEGTTPPNNIVFEEKDNSTSRNETEIPGQEGFESHSRYQSHQPSSNETSENNVGQNLQKGYADTDWVLDESEDSSEDEDEDEDEQEDESQQYDESESIENNYPDKSQSEESLEDDFEGENEREESIDDTERSMDEDSEEIETWDESEDFDDENEVDVDLDDSSETKENLENSRTKVSGKFAGVTGQQRRRRKGGKSFAGKGGPRKMNARRRKNKKARRNQRRGRVTRSVVEVPGEKRSRWHKVWQNFNSSKPAKAGRWARMYNRTRSYWNTGHRDRVALRTQRKKNSGVMKLRDKMLQIWRFVNFTTWDSFEGSHQNYSYYHHWQVNNQTDGNRTHQWHPRHQSYHWHPHNHSHHHNHTHRWPPRKHHRAHRHHERHRHRGRHHVLSEKQLLDKAERTCKFLTSTQHRQYMKIKKNKHGSSDYEYQLHFVQQMETCCRQDNTTVLECIANITRARIDEFCSSDRTAPFRAWKLGQDSRAARKIKPKCCLAEGEARYSCFNRTHRVLLYKFGMHNRTEAQKTGKGDFTTVNRPPRRQRLYSKEWDEMTPKQKMRNKCCLLGKTLGEQIGRPERSRATCNQFSRKLTTKVKPFRLLCHMSFGRCCIDEARNRSRHEQNEEMDPDTEQELDALDKMALSEQMEQDLLDHMTQGLIGE